MPIISWTTGDVLRSKTAEAGVYPAVLSEADGPKASNSGKGVNLFLTFRVTDGALAGKEFKIALSSGTQNGSILGDMQWEPLGATIAQITAAIKKVPLSVAAGQADTDELLNQPLDLNIAVVTTEGKLLNTITGYMPSGSAKGPSW